MSINGETNIGRFKTNFLGGLKKVALAGLFMMGAQTSYALSNMSASSDASNLYYSFSYSGTPNFYRAFLDADKNSATGFKGYGVGADYLLENGNLYKYSGSNGGWGWSRVKIVSLTNSNLTVRWIIAKTDIGSPAALNFVFQHDNPVTTSGVMSQSISAVVSNSISLTVAGAPNLPYNGTSTLVTVGFVGSAPAKVTLARDGLAAFATWPGGTFFTLASDGKSISGNWCITPSCWGNQSGSHYLTAVATYADGSSKSATLPLNAVTSSPSPTPTPTPIATPIATPTPTPTPVSSGPTYYVSPAGNDANSGSSSAPWRTIQKAANSVNPGDTVIIMNGIYEQGEINFQRGGTASAPITIRAQNKWQAIISSVSGCNPGISIRGSYIRIQDLRLTVSPNNVSCSIFTSANTDIRAWNSVVATPTNPTTGYVGFQASGLKVDPSTRVTSIKSNQDFTIIENSEVYRGMELLGSLNSVIRNVVIWTQDSNDVSLVVKGGVRNAQIYNNIIHQRASSGTAIVIGGGSCDLCHYDTSTNIEAYNSVAYNNVIINEGGGRLAALTFQGAKDSAFFNNVIIGGTVSMYQGGHNTGPQAPTQNPTLKNNIMVCNSANPSVNGGISYTGTLSIDYNDFYNCSGAFSQAHPIVGNPMFVNQASDWHLQPGSPAINSGTVLSMPAYDGGFIDLSRDFNGVVRASPWDLGIYNVAP